MFDSYRFILKKTLLLLPIFSFSLSVSFCFAQLPPTSSKAGILEEKIRQEEEKKETPVLKEKPLPPKIEDKRPQPVLSPEEITTKVYIKKFILSGVTKFKVEDFKPFLSKYRDTYLGITEFNQIAAYIQNFYRQKGYITTFVYIPVQKIENNTVEIRVVEGCIGTITVEGGKYFDKEVVKSRFRIKEGDVVLYKDMIRRLRFLNSYPDRTVKAVLLPGERLETTDVVLKLDDRNPKHIFLDYSNRGTKYTGKSRFGVNYVDNNLFGFEDMFSLRYQQGNERLYGISSDYNFPLNFDDSRLGIYFSYVKLDLAREFKVLNAKGKALTSGIYYSQPILDEDYLRSNFSLGLDIKRNKNYLLGETVNSDKLTVIKSGLSLDIDDALGRTFLSTELYGGIPYFLGSMGRDDRNASRLDAGGDFFKGRLLLTRRQNLIFDSFLLVSANGQATPDKLVNSEQYYIGGADTVRGYPELEYMGDYGYTFNVELRMPTYIFPKGYKLPKSKNDLRDEIQFVYFWDFGEAYLKDPLVGERRSDCLKSTGLGLRFKLWEALYLRLDWGFPLGPKPSDNSKSTVHVWANVKLF